MLKEEMEKKINHFIIALSFTFLEEILYNFRNFGIDVEK
jgi:hypothetical protein